MPRSDHLRRPHRSRRLHRKLHRKAHKRLCAHPRKALRPRPPFRLSPLPTYKAFIKLVKDGKLSFKHVVTFIMDEYVGLARVRVRSLSAGKPVLRKPDHQSGRGPIPPCFGYYSASKDGKHVRTGSCR
ncbi:hypothetical protein BV22DRAFT_742228 [Leucogyrophana mollusca]|uniref:Uncharacterized protein n=1 Tax=Leucogyrophana mollusca TaxID=85980 RepID=A0ACB8B781_9AGAM|nr:hypothetical protein BV22DRAFT_742228 [Leucogyrophana mollusca]